MTTYVKLILDYHIDVSIRDRVECRYTDVLYVFPDNVSSFREPAKSSARGGLAAVFRPMWVEGKASFAAAGIPTLSFDPSEPFTEAHIIEAFKILDTALASHKYDALVVPYTDTQLPAFGGGIAAPLTPSLMHLLKTDLARIATDCDDVVELYASKL